MRRSLLFVTSVIVVVGMVLSACSAGTANVQRTPIPTLIMATMPAPAMASYGSALSGKGECSIQALDLIGAWVKAGKSETDAFPFTASDGKSCTGTFGADIQWLFTEPNLWYSGSIACAACHGSSLKTSAAQMDLTNYAGIVAGSRRTDANAKGTSILDGKDGKWEQARIYTMIKTRAMPMGRPATSPEKGPTVLAGKKS